MRSTLPKRVQLNQAQQTQRTDTGDIDDIDDIEWIYIPNPTPIESAGWIYIDIEI